MTAPIITTRRFSPSLRLRLQVVFAKASEALAETYRAQGAEFVRRLTAWLPADEALDRYFRDVGVPASMIDTVRARIIITLAPLYQDSAAPEPESEEATSSWLSLRLDHLFGTLKQRAHYVEETNLQCRLAACVADEALATTHVRMALETAEALDGEISPDEAIMHYVRTFSLPALEAQIIFQRAMAEWAARRTPGCDAAFSKFERAALAAGAPKLELLPAPSFGLRLRASV
jgi:hypothetical protein